MKVLVHTAQEKLWEDNAKETVLPGEDGEFSVWDFHQDCVYRLRPGNIKIKPSPVNADAHGPHKNVKISIKRGIAEVKANRLFLLIERA